MSYWVEEVDRELMWFIDQAGTVTPVSMCEWKSVEICTLAAKVMWYEDDLKSLQ